MLLAQLWLENLNGNFTNEQHIVGVFLNKITALEYILETSTLLLVVLKKTISQIIILGDEFEHLSCRF
jgi:hypothetical protein